jgi:transcription initiation factor IIE alpha subunit
MNVCWHCLEPLTFAEQIRFTYKPTCNLCVAQMKAEDNDNYEDEDQDNDE